MHRHFVAFVAFAVVAGIIVAGCSGSSSQNSSSTSTTTGAATPAHTALPSNAKTPVTFNFSDVSVATSAANTLRLGFDTTNNSQDPLLCDSSEFYVQLDDGTVIPADGSAENSCDPETVDPNSSGKVVMFFDLPKSYTGGVTLFIVINDAVVGQGTT